MGHFIKSRLSLRVWNLYLDYLMPHSTILWLSPKGDFLKRWRSRAPLLFLHLQPCDQGIYDVTQGQGIRIPWKWHSALDIGSLRACHPLNYLLVPVCILCCMCKGDWLHHPIQGRDPIPSYSTTQRFDHSKVSLVHLKKRPSDFYHPKSLIYTTTKKRSFMFIFSYSYSPF